MYTYYFSHSIKIKTETGISIKRKISVILFMNLVFNYVGYYTICVYQNCKSIISDQLFLVEEKLSFDKIYKLAHEIK